MKKLWKRGFDCGLQMYLSPCKMYSILRNEKPTQYSIRITSGSIGNLGVCKEIHVTDKLADAKVWVENHKTI